MELVPDTAIPPYRRLITGLNREGPGTHVRRTRGTDDPLLMLTLSGAGFFRGNGDITPLQTGAMTMIPRGTPHDYGTVGEDRNWVVLWTHFHPWSHWEELLRWPREPSGARIIYLEDSVLRSAVEADFRLMHHDAISGHPHREILAMNALERVLLRCDQANPLQPANRLDARIQKAIDFIHAHLATPITVADLATAASLSPSRLAHLFADQVGTPPLHYLEAQRLDRARDLLACTPRPVSDIAAEVGFPNPFYFSRRFSKFTGLSPRAYRINVSAIVPAADLSLP